MIKLKEYEEKFEMNRYELAINAIFSLNLAKYLILGCSSVKDVNKSIYLRKKKNFPLISFTSRIKRNRSKILNLRT